MTLRDGEPLDAERKARVLADADRVREIARLEQARRALRGLPELRPPAEVWQRIAEELEHHPRAPRRAHGRPRRIASRAAAAAVGGAVLVAFAAAMIGDRADAPSIRETVANSEPASAFRSTDFGSTDFGSTDFESTEVAGSRPRDVTAEPAQALADSAEIAIDPAQAGRSRAEGNEARRFYTVPSEGVSTRVSRHSALAAESARLERVLGRIRFQPEVMNAGTAGTIVGLEDTLAALDEQLTFAAAGGLDPHERETLWRERVNVMRALVQVRYAQAQRSGL